MMNSLRINLNVVFKYQTACPSRQFAQCFNVEGSGEEGEGRASYSLTYSNEFRTI